MTEFEQQLAKALDDLRRQWVATGAVKVGELAQFLAPRVAAAISEVIEEFNGLLDDHGGDAYFTMPDGTTIAAHAAAAARAALEKIALAKLRGDV